MGSPLSSTLKRPPLPERTKSTLPSFENFTSPSSPSSFMRRLVSPLRHSVAQSAVASPTRAIETRVSPSGESAKSETWAECSVSRRTRRSRPSNSIFTSAGGSSFFASPSFFPFFFSSGLASSNSSSLKSARSNASCVRCMAKTSASAPQPPCALRPSRFEEKTNALPSRDHCGLDSQ